MKKLLFILLIMATVSLLNTTLPAVDDSAEKAIVPLSKPGQPAVLKAELVNGGITVTGYEGKEIIVDARVRSRAEEGGKTAALVHPGMKRVQVPGGSGLEVSEENNEVSISTDSWKTAVDLDIKVPFATSLNLNCVNGGNIIVENVSGEIVTENVNGKITLQNISGSVVASTVNGDLKVTFVKVDTKKAMGFSTLNGDVDVTFPGDIKATVQLKSDRGEIYSDFEIKLTGMPQKTVEDKRQEGGRYQVRFENTILGTINGGGQDMNFKTFNGDILLHKAK